MIDYRALLKKYINFVGSEEGITFISRIGPDDDFTPEEAEELRRLDHE